MLNKKAAKGAKPLQLGGLRGAEVVILVLGENSRPFPCPGETSHTIMVAGLKACTPATYNVPLSAMIASPAIIPLGPQSNSPLLVQNHLGCVAF